MDISDSSSQFPLNSQTLPAKQFQLGVVGSYLGHARFGAALRRLHNVKTVAIADADTRSARGWASELPGKPAIFVNVQKMLDAHPELEGVIVACSLADRATAIEACSAAGTPVLCEFPFASNLSGLDRLAPLAATNIILATVPYLHEPAFTETEFALEQNTVGEISRVRCEVSFPLNANYALDSGVLPVSIDLYDLLQVVACRTIDLCTRWLGEPLSVNADIDLPHHAAIAGRRASDPIANLIINHVNGQATHMLKLSRSVQPAERYLLTGKSGTLTLMCSSGEKAISGPELSVQVAGQRPAYLYQSPEGINPLTETSETLLLHFIEKVRLRDAGNPADYARLRSIFETVQAAFLSAKEGIRIPLPLVNPPDINSILETG